MSQTKTKTAWFHLHVESVKQPQNSEHQTVKKEIRFVVTRSKGGVGGVESGQNISNSSYKINKY